MNTSPYFTTELAALLGRRRPRITRCNKMRHPGHTAQASLPPPLCFVAPPPFYPPAWLTEERGIAGLAVLRREASRIGPKGARALERRETLQLKLAAATATACTFARRESQRVCRRRPLEGSAIGGPDLQSGRDFSSSPLPPAREPERPPNKGTSRRRGRRRSRSFSLSNRWTRRPSSPISPPALLVWGGEQGRGLWTCQGRSSPPRKVQVNLVFSGRSRPQDHHEGVCGGLAPELVPGDDEGQLMWISVGFAVELELIIGYLAEDDFSS
nr:PREDICTED: uncharacterized protein LOC106701323 [Bos mutus]